MAWNRKSMGWFVMAAMMLASAAATGWSGEGAESKEPDPLAAFPAAEAGQTRYVIRVPAKEDEHAFKVELVIGKTVQLDERNRYFFGGRLEEVDVQGWGYTRYVLKELGPMAGTLMAPLPGAPKVDRFITLGGEAKLFRYNSRMPIVVYVPSDVEVRYRVWSAGEEQPATKE